MNTFGSDREQMEAVWRQRAARLSRPATGNDANQNESQVLVLVAGEERYGIELTDVAEVLPSVRATPLPGAPPFLSGLINVHGEIRPVVDLQRLLDIQAVASDDLAPVVLLRRVGREMGLRVDRVEQIRKFALRDLQGGDLHRNLSTRYVRELTSDGLMVLSTDALFAELFKGTN
jgi:chemotaxis signal transduction protein